MDETKKKLIAKMLGGGAGAGGLIFMYLFFDSRTEALDAKIDATVVRVERQIDEKDMKATQSLDDIKKALEKIDSRLYDLVKQSKGEP